MTTSLHIENDLEQQFLDLYQQLNPAQKEAVDSTEGPVMVIAGPGTGKTQILAMRIANILRNPDLQISPQNILALTFTESAVTAMRNRLISIIGTEAYYVRIHTFHSFCNEVIKENPEKFFTINPISDLERIQIFNKIIDKLDPNSPVKPFGDPYLYRGDLSNLVQVLKRESIDVLALKDAIQRLESFLGRNSELIEAFVARNARTIKEEDCDLFLEQLYVANQNSEFTKLIKEYYQNADRITTFKKNLKDFYEKNLKLIPKQKELCHVYKEYQQELKSQKLYDFEDMILRVINQFENDPDLLARYQEQFLYILADEYQDTNGAQNRILQLLTQATTEYQKDPNIFVVGDDDQSIYRFQGASVENIIHFYQSFENTIKLIVLSQNYRSQQTILDIADSAIDQNQARVSKLIPSINKRLLSAGNAANYPLEKIQLIKTLNQEDELHHIAGKIKELTQTGTPAQEIAILFRENKEAIAIMDILARLGIRSKIDSGDNILEDRNIQQLLDLLTVINKPESNSALLFNVLNYQFITNSQDFKDAGITTRDVFNANRIMPRSPEPKAFIDVLLDSHLFKNWADKIITYKQLSANLKLDILIENIIKDFGYLDFVLKQPSYTSNISKLDALFQEIRNCTEMSKRYTSEASKEAKLGDLIEHFNLIYSNGLKIQSRTTKLQGDFVRLMTAHRSKGLEFEHVFVVNCRDKLWGNKTARAKIKLPPNLIQETESLLTDNQNEDERRLFYVAMTRAKKQLYISHHLKNSSNNDTVPSMFVSDLNKNELVEVQNLEAESQSQTAQGEIPVQFQEADDFAIIDAQEYITGLLENYKLSVTHLNNYLSCPRKFFYQNLLRVPSAKNKHASFGTAVHAALFDYFVALRQDDTNNANLEYLLKQFAEHLENEYLAEQEYKDTLGVGIEALTQYFNHYQAGFIKEIELEYDFSHKGINLDGIELTGKLDKIEIVEDIAGVKKVKVIDYKTGNPDGKSQALKPGGDYHRQIVFYQLLCELGYKDKLSTFKMISGEIDFIQASKTKGFVKSTIEVTNEDLDVIKAEIKTMYQSIQNQEFDKTEDLDTCSKCSFKNICGR